MANQFFPSFIKNPPRAISTDLYWLYKETQEKH